MDEHDLSVTAYLVGGAEDDSTDIADAVAALNLRLREIGTVRMPPAVAAPPGTRSGEIAEFGAICVAIAPIAPSLVAALKIFLSWHGPRGRRIKITGPDGAVFEGDNLSESEQQALVDGWLRSGQAPRE